MIRDMLWRLIYAVILVVILAFVVPLLFQLLGLSFPLGSGPAITLLKFAFACLVVLYVLFGPKPAAVF